MKQSVLHDSLPAGRVPGVRMGWTTALSFGDPEAEFQAACGGIALADHSMFGRIEVTGNDRLDLLHRLSTNSLTGLPPRGVIPTLFVTDKGRVIDSVIVSAREDSLILITSPGTELFLTRWIEKYTITEDIRFKIITDDTVMVSLIGLRIISMLSRMLDTPLDKNRSGALAHGGTNIFAIRSQDSRADVVHLITENAGSSGLIDMLSSLPGARWIGWMAYDGFRISVGIPASPGELTDAYNPFESGLRDSISFTKGCYLGQEVIARLDTYGKIRRHLTRVTSAEAPAGPMPVPMLKNGLEAGMLTSLTEIPFGGEYLGLAVLRNDIAAAGDRLDAGDTDVTVLFTVTASGT
jgi:folate-binding protein YgfZ